MNQEMLEYTNQMHFWKKLELYTQKFFTIFWQKPRMYLGDTHNQPHLYKWCNQQMF